MMISELHPYVHYATRYPFSKGQQSKSRICYSSSLYLISEGEGTATVQDRVYPTTPGSLVYIPAGVKHDWIADPHDPMVHVCCYFDWTPVNRLAAYESPHIICYNERQLLASLVGPSFPFPISEHTRVDKLWLWIEMFEKFYTPNELPNEKSYLRNLKVQGHFSQFIEFFLLQVLKGEQMPDPRISKLLEQLDQDLIHGQLQPLEAYYRKLRVSRGYFFELFKKTTGMSPVQYINLFRVNRAKEDLQFSGMSITEIAEKHHFSSIHYFSKLFRSYAGTTPTEYRERLIQQNEQA